MKIVAGMGSIDDYIALVEAGADEVFCGYVPYEWNKTYGNLFSLNRREVLYYNVQITSLEDMRILSEMVKVYKVPVSITFNYLYYLEEQYEKIRYLIEELNALGFRDYIIADIGLLLYLREHNVECSIHLSGETAELNHLSMNFFNEFDINRYIFHRKNTISDMHKCIEQNGDKYEYEAFIMNEKCHYSGAFCNSLHCDELEHLCKVPYRLSVIEGEYAEESEDTELEEENNVVGMSGCGLCSLISLRDAGITHLKVVGRGASIEDMISSIAVLKRALVVMEGIENNTEFRETIKNNIFNNNCSKNCYYY